MNSPTSLVANTAEEKLSKHTPTPWVVDDMYTDRGLRTRISGTDGRSDYYLRCPTIAECFMDRASGVNVVRAEANAAFIVLACNSFDALTERVAELEQARDARLREMYKAEAERDALTEANSRYVEALKRIASTSSDCISRDTARSAIKGVA